MRFGSNVIRCRIVFHQHLHLIGFAIVQGTVRIKQRRILATQQTERADCAGIVNWLNIANFTNIQLVKDRRILVFRIQIQEAPAGIGDLADWITCPDDFPQGGIGAVNNSVKRIIVCNEYVLDIAETARIDR